MRQNTDPTWTENLPYTTAPNYMQASWNHFRYSKWIDTLGVYSRFPWRSSYKKRCSVSSAINVFIHPLSHSFMHSIHISRSPHQRSFPMKQRTNKQSPSAQTHEGKSLYTMWCRLVPQRTYKGTKLYFQNPLFNQCIFNKN